ncbi:hypothetical protein CEXT_772641 [Caerostris extrusa]|uniref:Uncharacterized protein n=1 Tax=Caerostris extrusa TaxID=172846 RepID=A0AAV4NRB0_CAEEX|nr:hypothetical protein CEXT_772641 [Caerostris extrusa]
MALPNEKTLLVRVGSTQETSLSLRELFGESSTLWKSFVTYRFNALPPGVGLRLSKHHESICSIFQFALARSMAFSTVCGRNSLFEGHAARKKCIGQKQLVAHFSLSNRSVRLPVWEIYIGSSPVTSKPRQKCRK